MKTNKYNKLIILRAQLEQIVFKEFIKQYEMEKGLKQVHGITMLKLKHRKHMSMTELSHALNLEKASIKSIADKLIECGYIESNRSSKDRRVYNLELTKEGKVFADNFHREHNNFLENKFKQYSDKDLDKLFDALTYITDKFEELM